MKKNEKKQQRNVTKYFPRSQDVTNWNTKNIKCWKKTQIYIDTVKFVLLSSYTNETKKLSFRSLVDRKNLISFESQVKLFQIFQTKQRASGKCRADRKLII